MPYFAFKKFARHVLIAVAALASLPLTVIALWFLVRCATTSYCLEWVGCDGNVWEEMRCVPVEKGECLYVRFDYLNYARKDRFAVTIESRCDIALQDESATIHIDGRCHEEFRVRLSTCVPEKGRRLYFAALPQECMPQRENEVLRIQFKVCKPDGSLQRQEIVLEFRSRSIRHCFDLITDIT